MSATGQRARARRPTPADEAEVVSKAALRAAARLGLPNRVTGKVIGLSEASVSRMASGTYLVRPGEKPYELAVLFIRLFRSLDAIAAGDEATARGWLQNGNVALGARPVAMIQTVSGLVTVVGYLDARRALV